MAHWHERAATDATMVASTPSESTISSQSPLDPTLPIQSATQNPFLDTSDLHKPDEPTSGLFFAGHLDAVIPPTHLVQRQTVKSRYPLPPIIYPDDRSGIPAPICRISISHVPRRTPSRQSLTHPLVREAPRTSPLQRAPSIQPVPPARSDRRHVSPHALPRDLIQPPAFRPLSQKSLQPSRSPLVRRTAYPRPAPSPRSAHSQSHASRCADHLRNQVPSQYPIDLYLVRRATLRHIDPSPNPANVIPSAPVNPQPATHPLKPSPFFPAPIRADIVARAGDATLLRLIACRVPIRTGSDPVSSQLMLIVVQHVNVQCLDLHQNSWQPVGHPGADLSHQHQPRASSHAKLPIANTHSHCTLVLCFDGTGDEFGADNSNIVQFCSLLPKANRTKQLVYYQAGISTYFTPEIASPVRHLFSKLADEHLDRHVKDGYEFLMQNYIEGDSICIFGFSRGAYIARSLAGMLHKVGLLPVSNYEQVPFAYKMYKHRDRLGWKQSNTFKRTFSSDVSIRFLGVWDTVASVGLIPHTLPFTTSNTIVKTFRHAMALDERRVKFKVNMWNRPTTDEVRIGSEFVPNSGAEPLAGSHQHYQMDVKGVWFAGCHCDVGGGSVANETVHNLARIPLRWMIRECFEADSGLAFPNGQAPPAGRCACHRMHVWLDTRTAAQPMHKAILEDPILGKPEEEHDLVDALAPVYDQLSLHWFWWILEIIPWRQRYQRNRGTWVTVFRANWGRARVIPDAGQDGVQVHRSIKKRMEAEGINGKPYHPRAVVHWQHTTWVD
ncbi:DUF2235 domain-containing protein [Mycena indigotica]|uniref:DUF2235 domain-containing protein n=1 Tax=Mycena indigotica TaxID=2126181 RepID=A0A8H6S1Y0_9AGAR|nr:DUF2235 domain-containing protein [Mycena indigotica]KAF7290730.1 DUF2235 domain-containing protein [Mycena indigotica]